MVAATVIFATLFFYIPYITEKNSIEMATKSSIISAEQIKLTRAYYVDSVVKDIKKYAPNIKFTYDHEGLNGEIPLPTTTIHNLSAIFSANSGLKYNLYSKYPFASKKDRKLGAFQKEALRKSKLKADGIYVKKDFIDNKPVLRVAVSDFMTDQACVDCHNSHPERTWDEGMWKLGDNRGVLEVITPLDDVITSNLNARNHILIILSIIGTFLILYLAYTMLSREKKLLDANDELQEEFKNLFIDFDKNVIASTTDLKGKIIYASEMFCKLSQYSREELIGTDHNIVRHPDMPKEAFRDMWETIQAGKVWEGEVKNLKKDGGYYWVDATISPVFDEEGNIIEYNAIRHDITIKKEIQKLNINLEDRVSKAIIETKEKEQHMLNQSKMAQMGEMLSMIAHQWRQPLTSISATASSMEIKIALAKFDEEYFMESLQNIQNYSQHLSSTIDDFRNFFKNSKVINKTTFKQIINSTMSIINTSLKDRSITIKIENDCIEPLCIYENEFKQVALNLFKNAEDALLENNIKDGMIKIKTYKKGQNAVFEIIDNAGGIKDEIAKQIFDPYFSTKDAKNGTGLGLYMSKTIIQEHCFGTLEHSNTEDGSKFTIVIDPIRFCDEANLS